MNIPDLVFLTGPFGGGLVLTIVSCAVIAAVKRPRWVYILGATLTAVFVCVLCVVVHRLLVSLGKAFDYADADKPVPARLDIASNVAMTLCSIAALALVVLAAAAVLAKRHPGAKLERTATPAHHL